MATNNNTLNSGTQLSEDLHEECPKYFVPTPPRIMQAIRKAWWKNAEDGDQKMSYQDFMTKCNELGVSSHICSGLSQKACNDILLMVRKQPRWKQMVKKRGKDLNAYLLRISAEEHIYGAGYDSDDYYEQIVDDMARELNTPRGTLADKRTITPGAKDAIKIAVSNELLKSGCDDAQTAAAVYTTLLLLVLHMGNVSARCAVHFRSKPAVMSIIRSAYMQQFYELYGMYNLFANEVLRGIKCEKPFDIEIPENLLQGHWNIDCGDGETLHLALKQYDRYMDDPQTWTRLAIKENLRAKERGDISGSLLAFDAHEAIAHGWVSEEEIIEAFGCIPKFVPKLFDSEREQAYAAGAKKMEESIHHKLTEEIMIAAAQKAQVPTSIWDKPGARFTDDEMKQVLEALLNRPNDAVDLIAATLATAKATDFDILTLKQTVIDVAGMILRGEKPEGYKEPTELEKMLSKMEIDHIKTLKPRVKKLLHEHGVNTVGDIVGKNVGDMMQWKGFGPAAMENLTKSIESLGICVREKGKDEPRRQVNTLALPPSISQRYRRAIATIELPS